MFELHSQIIINFSIFYGVGIFVGVVIGTLSFAGGLDLINTKK